MPRITLLSSPNLKFTKPLGPQRYRNLDEKQRWITRLNIKHQGRWMEKNKGSEVALENRRVRFLEGLVAGLGIVECGADTASSLSLSHRH